MWEKYSKSINDLFLKNKIKLRPQGNLGIWATILLPLAITVTSINYPQDCFINYKLSSIVSIGFCITTYIFLYYSVKLKLFEHGTIIYVISWVLTAFLISFVGKRGIGFSIFSGFLSSIFYIKLLLFALKSMPLSFTFGEASITAQAITLLLYTTFINLHKTLFITPTQNIDISTIIIQVGLIGIGIICLLNYLYPFLRKTYAFYTFFTIAISCFILIPLHVILKTSPLLWILNLLTADLKIIALIIYWILCCMLAVFTINKQIENQAKANTVVRKTFHFLAVATFIPGLWYKCTVLYLASGVVLGIFITIELIRNIKLPPFAEYLEEGFTLYSDEKDAGSVALTPIYLLIGISVPLWIHPTPCDMIDSAGFNLLTLMSGIFTVGIGDTGASFFGTNFGKHHWPKSNKTIEGTLGCIVSQLLLLLICYLLGIIPFNYFLFGKALAAIIITSLIEALTSQVDNLVLPLISYIITV